MCIRDSIWLLEINTRISQSHCDIFEKVDGISNQQVTIDLGLGQRPNMPHRQGEFPMAAKFFHRVFFTDAVVTRVPSEAELTQLQAEFPGCQIAVQVEEGQRLSTLPEQDAYSFALAHIYMGASSAEQLLADYDRLVARLAFEFDDIQG